MNKDKYKTRIFQHRYYIYLRNSHGGGNRTPKPKRI